MPENDEKVGEKYFSGDFSSFWNSLTRSLPKGFQKQALLSVKVGTSFGFNNFRNLCKLFSLLQINFSDNGKVVPVS